MTFDHQHAVLWHPTRIDGRGGPLPTAPHVGIRDVEPTPEKADLGNFTLDVYRLSSEAFEKLTGNQAKGEFRNRVDYLLMDLACYATEGVISEDGGQTVLEIDASGIRIVLEASDMQVEAGGDIGAFSAAAVLGKGNVTFSYSYFGFKSGELPVLNVSMGPLSAEAFQELTKRIVELIDFVAEPKNSDAFSPVRAKVAVLGGDPFDDAWSMHAALEKIWWRQSWKDANEQIAKERLAQEHYVPLMARMMYDMLDIKGGVADDRQAKVAWDLLMQGR